MEDMEEDFSPLADQRVTCQQAMGWAKEKTNVISGKAFLAETRTFYNNIAKFCLNS